jgi:hypothetical protein
MSNGREVGSPPRELPAFPIIYQLRSVLNAEGTVDDCKLPTPKGLPRMSH